MSDGMPVFVIKAKDELSLEIIRLYGELCAKKGLDEQAKQVAVALDEFEGWQLDYPDMVQLPDHKHVPAVPVQLELEDGAEYNLRIRRSVVVEALCPVSGGGYPDMTAEEAQQYELHLDRETHIESIIDSLSVTEPSQDEDDRATLSRIISFLRVEVTIESA